MNSIRTRRALLVGAVILLLSAKSEAIMCQTPGAADGPFFMLSITEEKSQASVQGIYVTASNGFSGGPVFRKGADLKSYGTGEGKILLEGAAEVRSQMNAVQKCEVRISFPNETGYILIKAKDGSSTSLHMNLKTDLEIGSGSSFYPVADLFKSELTELKCRPSEDLYERVCNKGEAIPAGPVTSHSPAKKASAAVK